MGRNALNPVTTVALDAGNYQIKGFMGQEATIVRSVQYRLPGGLKPLQSKANSPLIEFENDGAVERWHVGSQAFKYRTQQQTVLTDKSQLAKLHLYSVVKDPGSYRLIVSHHSPEHYGETLRSALIGTHNYNRNGVKVSFSVEEVIVVPEGMGSYWLMQQQQAIPENGYTIVIDIGGSTYLARVLDQDGDEIFSTVGERLGTYDLAAAICTDDRLKEPLRRFDVTSPNPGLVMDGLCGGHEYEFTGVKWGEWLEEYLSPWFRNLINDVNARCTAHLSRTTRYIITGGAANLIRDKVELLDPKQERFVIPQNPSIANVQGAYWHFHPATAATNAA